MAAARDWDSTFNFDQHRIQEFQFWRLNISKFNSREVNPISNSSHNFVVYLDPSQAGSGAHMALNGVQICHKQWIEAVSPQSSTRRELSAIEFALKSFSPMLNHSCVRWFSDSQLACTIAQEGSMCRDLHGIALRIYQFCLEQEIEFCRSHDDWQITRECLDALEKLWGRHT